MDVNLLPPEVLAQQRPQWGRTLLLTAALVLLIWTGYTIFRVRIAEIATQTTLQQLRLQAARLSGYAAEQARLARTLQVLRVQDAFAAGVHRAQWAQALGQMLQQGQSTGVAVGQLTWKGSGDAALVGTARSLRSLARFVALLRASGFWTDVRVGQAVRAPGGSYTFQAMLTPGPWADPLDGAAGPGQEGALARP